ncbi:MAG: hypothetical protein ACRYGM_09005 [Janthinobacterium lividum]
MAGKIDHEKAHKVAKIRKRGAEGIGGDATLLRTGRPHGHELAQSLPERRSDYNDISPLIYKQEPLKIAEAEARRLEAAKAKGPKRPKKPIPRPKKLNASKVKMAAVKAGSTDDSSISKLPTRSVTISYEIQQRLPGKGVNRTVQAEVLRSRKP